MSNHFVFVARDSRRASRNGFLCVFATICVLISSERPRRSLERTQGSPEIIGRSEEFVSQQLLEVAYKLQADADNDAASHAANEVYAFCTQMIPFAKYPHEPLKKSKPPMCKYDLDCSYTRLGIGRRGIGLYWTFVGVIPVGMASLIIWATSLKHANHGKLTMQTGKAATAMIFAAFFAYSFGLCARDVSTLRLSSEHPFFFYWPGLSSINFTSLSFVCLLLFILLLLALSTIATFYFVDIEVGYPHFGASAFLTCAGIVLFLTVFVFEACLSYVVVLCLQSFTSPFVRVSVIDFAYGLTCIGAAFMPRNTGLLLWLIIVGKYYIGYFYFWDDTTGDGIDLMSPTRFPSFALLFVIALIQFNLPYSRDRYFTGAFGWILQLATKLGSQRITSVALYNDAGVYTRLTELCVVILAGSIWMRYQIALPIQLQKVKYVRVEYLFGLRRKGLPITRCQELPETAFGNPAKVVHLIIVSHHWLDGHTCDVPTRECPHGFRLTTICQRLENFFPSTFPGFSVFCAQPLTILRKIIVSTLYSADDVLVFLDFMSLPQIGMMPDGTLIQRTPDEAEVFKEILPACGLLYTMFPVLVCPEVSTGVTSYMSSGWCFCEWEQAHLCGTLSPYSEDVDHGDDAHSESGSGFEFVEAELKEKGFRCEPDREIVRGIVKGTWIRRKLLSAVLAQNVEELQSLLNQLFQAHLQVTISFPVDSETLDTLLHIAMKLPSEGIVSSLIAYGADPKSPNHRGELPGQFFILPRSWFDSQAYQGATSSSRELHEGASSDVHGTAKVSLTQAETLEMMTPSMLKDGVMYKKFGYVFLKRGTAGETVESIIDGKVETTNIVKPGDWILRNDTTSKELMVLPDEKRCKLYSQDPVPNANHPDMDEISAAGFTGPYQPRGRILALEVIPTMISKYFSAGTFQAPWGELTVVQTGDFLVAPAPPEETGRPKTITEIYLIEKIAFQQTYAREQMD